MHGGSLFFAFFPFFIYLLLFICLFLFCFFCLFILPIRLASPGGACIGQVARTNHEHMLSTCFAVLV